jgi:hypothetical protein
MLANSRENNRVTVVEFSQRAVFVAGQDLPKYLVLPVHNRVFTGWQPSASLSKCYVYLQVSHTTPKPLKPIAQPKRKGMDMLLFCQS